MATADHVHELPHALPADNTVEAVCQICLSPIPRTNKKNPFLVTSDGLRYIRYTRPSSDPPPRSSSIFIRFLLVRRLFLRCRKGRPKDPQTLHQSLVFLPHHGHGHQPRRRHLNMVHWPRKTRRPRHRPAQTGRAGIRDRERRLTSLFGMLDRSRQLERFR